MKKIFGLALVVCLVLGLVGCSDVDNRSIDVPPPSPTETLSNELIFDILKEKYDVEYLGKDIEYNIPNMLDKEFAVAGNAILSDHYNYGFEDAEEKYYCIKVEPLYNTSKEDWYVYLNREYFNEFYDELIIVGEKYAVFICSIPSIYYTKGQSQMAFGHNIAWN